MFDRRLERKIDHQTEEIEELERGQEELLRLLRPRLSFIKITFGGNMAQGPATLTIGDKKKATVLGFDQNGAAWTGAIPPVTYSIDNAALDSSTPDATNGDDLVSLAVGVANLTASLTTAEGKALSDTEQITNVAAAPVLSSIKIDIS